MSEIDPLVFKLIADTKAAQAEARRTATTMGQSFGRVERDILKLENQMKRSSGAIAGQLRGLAGTLGTAFGAREIGQIIDNFTRLQNSLKVSGLEGEALGRVQERLLELSGRYGVSINELANLYGKASQSGKELGASEAQLLQITEASAQALKISGTSAAQAQGALLGLSQALAAGTVRAEEYNQILEGGLQPLLQVAANTDKYGGSLARLRQAVIDGKVSSQELFDSILAGSAQLDAQASKATLTLAGAFEALASQLTVYVGQSAEASGVTAALAGGIKLLADNLDIIIPALALIAATMGTSLVVNALAGSRAFFALTAAMGGAATAAEAATFAFGGLGAVLTGPVGIAAAVVAVGAGLIYLANSSYDAEAAVKDLEQASQNTEATLAAYISRLKEGGASTEELARVSAIAAGKIDVLADSYNRASVEAHKLATNASLATIELLKQQAVIAAASKTRQAQLEGQLYNSSAASIARMQVGLDPVDPKRRAELEAQIAQEKRVQRNADAAQEALKIGFARGIDLTGAKPSPPSTAAAKKTGGSRSRAGSGRDPLDDAFRNAQEFRQLQLEEIRAKEQDAQSAKEKADLAREGLALEAEIRRKEIDEAVRKGQLRQDEADARKKIIENLYGVAAAEGDIVVQGKEAAYQRAITREEQERIARQQTDAMRSELEALGAEAGVTDVRKSRVEIERRMLDLQQQIERKLLEEAIARGDIADAAAERAKLARKQAADRKGFEEDSKGPLGQYLDEIRKVGLNMDDEFEKVAVNGLQTLNDGLTDAIVNSKNLGDVFKNVAKQIIADLIRIAIQQTIVNSLANALSGAFGGGIGGGGSNGIVAGDGFWNVIFGSGGLFGRASGGFVAPGQTVRVNEHRGGVEGFRPTGSGTIIPIGQMNAMAARSGSESAVARVQLDLSGDLDARIVSVSGPVAVEVVRSAAPSIVDAASNETMRRANRPRMPGAGR